MAERGRLTVEHRLKTVLLFAETKSVVVTQRRFRAHFQTRWSPSFKTIHKLYEQYNRDGTVSERKRKRAASVLTPEKIDAVRAALQESPTKSARKVAAELGISRRSVQRILKNDLNCYLQEKNAENVQENDVEETTSKDTTKSNKRERAVKKNDDRAGSEEPETTKPRKTCEIENEKIDNSDDEEEQPEEEPVSDDSENKDANDESEIDDEESAEKPAKRNIDKKDRNDEVAAKKTKVTDEDDIASLENQTATSYVDVDFNICQKGKQGQDWNFKISNWNVDGIRSWIKKGGLQYIDYEKPDIFCIQEIKCSEDNLPLEVKQIDGYKAFWHCSKEEGYAGVGLYSKIEPISVSYGMGKKDHDDEGRIITAEFDQFYVISVYVPNARGGLVTLPERLEWYEEFHKYIENLNNEKPVIICGDMNVSHTEMDVTDPETNTENAGFTKEETEGTTTFLRDGYVDTFKHFYPEKTQAYTCWSYMANCRAKNIGWRLDYFLVSKRFIDSVCDTVIRSEVFGSDHCPITLFLCV